MNKASVNRYSFVLDLQFKPIIGDLQSCPTVSAMSGNGFEAKFPLWVAIVMVVDTDPSIRCSDGSAVTVGQISQRTLGGLGPMAACNVSVATMNGHRASHIAGAWMTAQWT